MMWTAMQGAIITWTISFAVLWIITHAGTIVYPRLLESRTDDGGLVLNIREGLTLNLRKSSILAKEFVLTSSAANGTEEQILDVSVLERDLYHYTEHLSSVLISRRGNGVEVSGILKGRLRIAPAVANQRSDGDVIPHNVFIVQPRSGTTSGELDDDGEIQCPHRNAESVEATKQTNHSALFTVELCVVVGQAYAKAFSEIEDLITYVASFIDMVGHHFLGMTEPFMRFQLNGISIVEDASITGRRICGLAPHLFIYNVCAVDAYQTLNETANFMNSLPERKCDLYLQLPSADLAGQTLEESVDNGIQGLAYIGKVCTNLSVAVVEDRPHTYTGTSALAHEIAHALGATHDGLNITPPDVDGYPTAHNCSSYDEYLMGPAASGRNVHSLSNCTKAQIRFWFGTLPLCCTEVRTEATYPNDIHPGEFEGPLTVVFQNFCQALHPERGDVEAYYNPDGNQECQIRCCWNHTIERLDEEDTYPDDYYGALQECGRHSTPETMPCGDNKTCWQGVCGEHNWTEISKNFRTYRTFQTLQFLLR